MKHTLILSLLLLLTETFAATAADEFEVISEGLSNPTGVAIQPGTGHIFVAESAAGRVIRIVDGQAEEAITGFPQDIYGQGPEYKIGPLGLAFFDETKLVVSGGEQVDTEEVIRVFELPEAGEPPIAADDATTVLGPLDAEGELRAEGDYYGVALTPQALYVTANGDDTQGWVVRSPITGTRFGDLERWLATKEAVEVDAPVGITISPRGEIVVGQMGEIGAHRDSLLTFYSANEGSLLLKLETDLYDITALAYSPEGHLYALDFAWSDSEEGGLFRLDKSSERSADTCDALKILSLDKPTALAFGDDGSLYITLFGTTAEGSDQPDGQLIRIMPGL